MYPEADFLHVGEPSFYAPARSLPPVLHADT
jgi:hypothetical protein